MFFVFGIDKSAYKEQSVITKYYFSYAISAE